MKPAAKVGDLCLHAGKVQTGSPDTTTNDKKSARLGDIHDCKSHPPGFPPWPPGPIVTGSSTVFINRLKAARHTDKLMCGAPGPPPPGAANPQTAAYDVRPDDKYQTLMEIEHEIQERDKIKDAKEPNKGDIGEIDDPLGIKDAKVPKPKPHKSPPSGQGVAFKGGGSKSHGGNPYTGSESRQGRRDFHSEKLSSDVESPAMTQEVPLGDNSVAVVAGPKKAGDTGPAVSTKTTTDEEGRKRYTITIKLGFHLELSVGTRTTVPFGGVPMDTIIPIPGTVWIG
jgi:uncharacterized Zn-binding protein involved in type VI secretion